jgi:hypothetical protein
VSEDAGVEPRTVATFAQAGIKYVLFKGFFMIYIPYARNKKLYVGW